MSLNSCPPKRKADYLAALSKPDKTDDILVNELLYFGETTFMVADPGVGKSTLATQIALSVTSGEPVFGVFAVTRPVFVYYIAFETRWERHIRTVRAMSRELHPNLDLMCFDPSLAGLDLCQTSENDSIHLISKITGICKTPGLVILDPAYLTVAKDLKDGESARALATFCNRLANNTGTSILVPHHSHRERMTVTGKLIIEDDPIYGSRWLQAHMAVGWNIKANEDGSGTHWKRTKDRFKLSRREFTLTYDDTTQLSSAGGSNQRTVLAKLTAFVRTQEPGNRFTYSQLANQVSCNETYIKEVMREPVFEVLLEKQDESGGKTYWKVKPNPNYVDTSAMDNHSTGGRCK